MLDCNAVNVFILLDFLVEVFIVYKFSIYLIIRGSVYYFEVTR
jgi:hypothetical protein